MIHFDNSNMLHDIIYFNIYFLLLHFFQFKNHYKHISFLSKAKTHPNVLRYLTLKKEKFIFHNNIGDELNIF